MTDYGKYQLHLQSKLVPQTKPTKNNSHFLPLKAGNLWTQQLLFPSCGQCIIRKRTEGECLTFKNLHQYTTVCAKKIIHQLNKNAHQHCVTLHLICVIV